MIGLSKESAWNHHVVTSKFSAFAIGVYRLSNFARHLCTTLLASSHQMPAEKFRGFRPRQSGGPGPVII